MRTSDEKVRKLDETERAQSVSLYILI